MALQLPMLDVPLRQYLNDYILFRSTPPDVARAFADHAREESIRLAYVFLAVGVFAAIAWWPTDYFLFAEHPEVIRAFAHLRVVIVLLAVTFVAGLERLPWTRAHLATWWTLHSGLFIGECAWFVGGVSTPQNPANSLFILAPALSLLLLVSIGTRILVALLIAASFVAAFFLMHPSNLYVPGAASMLTNLAYTLLLSIATGQGLYAMFRTSFLQRRELDELSTTLAQKVEERTAELRRLARHVQELQETERATLARELHDELGQCLSGMRIELNLAQRRLASGGDVEGQHKLLSGLLDTTLASMRALLNGLRPRVLDDLGIVPALESLVADVGRRAGLRIDFRAEPDELETSPEVGIALFRIAQEALTNVVRHAEAKEVRIQLRLSEGQLLLTVADDGKGLKPGGRAGSMGLLGMRERAAALGGTLTLMENTPRGTIVTVNLPLQPKVAQEAA